MKRYLVLFGNITFDERGDCIIHSIGKILRMSEPTIKSSYPRKIADIDGYEGIICPYFFDKNIILEYPIGTIYA